MTTRTLLSLFVLVASVGAAAGASAAEGSAITRPEFGRDGVPRVTARGDGFGPAAGIQPYGRGVPETRAFAARTRPAVQSHSESNAGRFGRA